MGRKHYLNNIDDDLLSYLLQTHKGGTCRTNTLKIELARELFAGGVQNLLWDATKKFLRVQKGKNGLMYRKDFLVGHILGFGTLWTGDVTAHPCNGVPAPLFAGEFSRI